MCLKVATKGGHVYFVVERTKRVPDALGPVFAACPRKATTCLRRLVTGSELW